MRKVLTRFGFYCFFVTLAIHGFSNYLGRNNYEISTNAEIIGTVLIILPLLLILAAQLYYRDRINRGNLNFGEAFKLGILLTLITGIFAGVFDVIFIKIFNPDYADLFFSKETERLRKDNPMDMKQQMRILRETREFMKNDFSTSGFLF